MFEKLEAQIDVAKPLPSLGRSLPECSLRAVCIHWVLISCFVIHIKAPAVRVVWRHSMWQAPQLLQATSAILTLLPPAAILLPPAAILLPPAGILLPPAAILLLPAAILLPPAAILLPPAAILLPAAAGPSSAL